MSSFDLLQKDPGLYLLLILLSLALTVLVYGAFPLIFALTRKSPVTKKKYKGLCYGINLAFAIIFALVDGTIGMPYILWTWVFSSYGLKVMTRKNLIGQPSLISPQIAYHTKQIMFCKKCGTDIAGGNFCRKCGEKITQQSRFCRRCGIELEENSIFCRKCGTKIQKETYL